ncbi:MAG: hypothetical protein ACI9OJ_001031, partial [Myxococcota bacterium]
MPSAPRSTNGPLLLLPGSLLAPSPRSPPFLLTTLSPFRESTVPQFIERCHFGTSEAHDESFRMALLFPKRRTARQFLPGTTFALNPAETGPTRPQRIAAWRQAGRTVFETDGSKVIDLIDKFHSVVAELQHESRVVVTCAWVGAPATHEQVRAAEARLGARLPAELAEFYRAANGLQLRWSPAERPGLILDGTPLAPSEMALMEDTGCINILPLVHLGRRIAAGQQTDEQVMVDGECWPLYDLRMGFHVVDFYSSLGFSGLLRLGRSFDTRMLAFVDFGATFPDQAAAGFRAHLERAL